MTTKRISPDSVPAYLSNRSASLGEATTQWLPESVAYILLLILILFTLGSLLLLASGRWCRRPGEEASDR